MMKAAIDIGTNTVLLLIAEQDGQDLTVIHEEHRVPRLGKGVDADQNIGPEATQRVIHALQEYKVILEQDFPKTKETIVTATSAVRDARNRDEFMEEVADKTGFRIRLLSGDEEARCTAQGALSVLEVPARGDQYILDIGGGSTEVAHLQDGELKDGYSYDMGSVRFTERYLHQNPPAEIQIEKCRTAIQDMYDSRPFDLKAESLGIGVAGTVTTLAGMALQLNSYQPETINGYALSLSEVQKAVKEFSRHPHEEMLQRNPVYLKGREDIFLAGLLILEGFMINFHLDTVVVSTGGIRHGAILQF